jgi:hypothetical protein
MLACHVTWHMQQRLAPMLFKDHDPAAGRAARSSPVAPARRSPAALAKAATKAAADGRPVHSFATVLADLATTAANRIQPAGGLPAFTVITTPTPVQRRAFELLGISHRLGYRSQAASDHRAFPQADALPHSTRGELRARNWANSARSWGAPSGRVACDRLRRT